MDSFNRQSQEMIWHNDGHKLHLRINRCELEVVSIDCPNGESGQCWVEDFGCAVTWFVDRFGMEPNAGACPAAETIEVCWTLAGNKRDLDEAQLWFMPITDEVFQAWFTAKIQSF